MPEAPVHHFPVLRQLYICLLYTSLDRIQFQDGKPLSSKRNGVGIGTVSIQDIARRYHGSARFEYREHVFYTSVIMHYEQRKSIQKQVAAQEYVQNDTIQSKAAA